MLDGKRRTTFHVSIHALGMTCHRMADFAPLRASKSHASFAAVGVKPPADAIAHHENVALTMGPDNPDIQTLPGPTGAEEHLSSPQVRAPDALAACGLVRKKPVLREEDRRRKPFEDAKPQAARGNPWLVKGIYPNRDLTAVAGRRPVDRPGASARRAPADPGSPPKPPTLR